MGKRKNFIRMTLALLQAAFDVSIYTLSSLLVVWLWPAVKTSSILTLNVQIFFAGTILAIFCFNSLYHFKTWLLWDEMKAVIKSSFFILLVAVLYLYSQKSALSRFIVIFSMIMFVPLCIISRYMFRRLLFALGLLSTNIMILGAGRTGKIFAEKITNNPFTLGKISGFLDDDDAKQGINIAGFKVLGKIEDFESICGRENIDEVAVAISTASREFLAHILDLVEFNVRHVHYIPDMYMLTAFSPLVRDIDGMPIISASCGLLNPLNRAVKSFADYAGGIAAIVMFSPLMLWAALKVRMKHGGEILSSHKRLGLNGETFMMYKFRSSRETGTDAKLRRSYIDELPQLFNVIKGEMSLVGPKALLVNDMSHVYGENAGKINTVKPGITGFWQVSQQSDNDRKVRREMDLYYIRNWSIWLDTVILLKTLITILLRKKI